jgi:photosystem II stability/assembly factor-like uncharacterized protein
MMIRNRVAKVVLVATIVLALVSCARTAGVVQKKYVYMNCLKSIPHGDISLCAEPVTRWVVVLETTGDEGTQVECQVDAKRFGEAIEGQWFECQ